MNILERLNHFLLLLQLLHHRFNQLIFLPRLPLIFGLNFLYFLFKFYLKFPLQTLLLLVPLLELTKKLLRKILIPLIFLLQIFFLQQKLLNFLLLMSQLCLKAVSLLPLSFFHVVNSLAQLFVIFNLYISFLHLLS